MAFLFALLVLVVYAVSFFVTAGILWLICWAFALTFTWKIAIGIWLVLILARSVFQVTVKNS